jgi:hypothetical protein
VLADITRADGYLSGLLETVRVFKLTAGSRWVDMRGLCDEKIKQWWFVVAVCFKLATSACRGDFSHMRPRSSASLLSGVLPLHRNEF